MITTKKIWSKEETSLLIQTYHLYTYDELAEIFECTNKQVSAKLSKLGLANKREELQEGYLKCRICKEILPEENFHSNKSKATGKSSECMNCARLTRIMKRRQVNLDKERKNKEEIINKYIEERKNKILKCKKHGNQTIDDYRVVVSSSGSASSKCKKCEKEYAQRIANKKLKEKGYI